MEKYIILERIYLTYWWKNSVALDILEKYLVVIIIVLVFSTSERYFFQGIHKRLKTKKLSKDKNFTTVNIFI